MPPLPTAAMKPPASAQPTAQSSVPDAALFELAFRHAGIGMALVGLDGRWMKVNDGLCRIVAYEREELLQLDFQTITHPDDLELDLEFVRRLMVGELDSYDLEKRYLRKDGEVVWIHLTATLVRGDSSEPLFFIAQIQDVTRRRQAESEVEAFFDASPDMLAIAGTDGSLILVNAAWQRTLGWTKDEITSRPFMDLVHADDRERTQREATLAYRGEGSSTFRNRYVTKNGSYRWLEWNSRRLPRGSLYCVVRDVTERVESEQARGWLAALVECSGDAVIGVDTAGSVLSWNAGAERLFGFSSQEMLGRSITALIPEGEPNVMAALQHSDAEQSPFRFETRRRKKDGQLVDTHLTVSPVRGREGEVLGWCGISRNVTHEKAQRQELTRTKALLEATFANIRDGVALLDEDRKILLANAAYDEMLGLPPGGSVGMGPTEAIAHIVGLAEDPELVRAILVPTPQLEEERIHDLLLKRPERRWVRRTLASIGGDAQARYLVVWRDVTLERDLMAEREREVLTDALTCIPNRRAAEAAMVRELVRVSRGISCASVVVFDIDHFKRINDQHGHPMGDAVLCQVARTMSELTRETDCLARWGGEEFVAVIAGDVYGATAFAERVRNAIKQSEFPGNLRVTLSGGVTQCRNGDTAIHAVARADRALYRAKAEGRDRVICE